MALNCVFAAYLEAAVREKKKADHEMARAERLFFRLRRRMGNDRAYEFAGVPLADRRSIAAGKWLRDARRAMVDACLGGEPGRQLGCYPRVTQDQNMRN